MLATACSVSFDRLNARPATTTTLTTKQCPNHKHPKINAGVWGLVTINSRAVHTNDKCNVHKEERPTTKVNKHAHTCPPILETFDQH